VFHVKQRRAELLDGLSYLVRKVPRETIQSSGLVELS
jgi:hypothetical protein